MSIIAALLCNTVNYAFAYQFMPEINIFLLLILLIIVPSVFNVLIYLKKPNRIHLIGLPLLTTVSYFISGTMMENSGKWQILINEVNRVSGDLVIQVSDRIADPAQIITLFLTQLAVLIIADKLFIKRGAKNDRSFKFEQKVF